MLKPLEEFICDVCGGVIEDLEKGILNADSNETMQYHNFSIVHQGKCDSRAKHVSFHLNSVVGPNSIGTLINLIHSGPVADPKGTGEIEIADHVEFAEIMRRLQVPYYDEARQYFMAAAHDGYLDGNSEGIAHARSLKNVIEMYESKE